MTVRRLWDGRRLNRELETLGKDELEGKIMYIHAICS